MLKPEVVKTIEAVLREQLGPLGFDHAEVVESEDHDGMPILNILVFYNKVGAKVNLTPTFSLARHIKNAIRPLGEDRFPHFQHRFPEGLRFEAA